MCKEAIVSLGLVLKDKKPGNVKVRVSFRSQNPARLTSHDLNKLPKHYDSASSGFPALVFLKLCFKFSISFSLEIISRPPCNVTVSLYKPSFPLQQSVCSGFVLVLSWNLTALLYKRAVFYSVVAGPNCGFEPGGPLWIHGPGKPDLHKRRLLMGGGGYVGVWVWWGVCLSKTKKLFACTRYHESADFSSEVQPRGISCGKKRGTIKQTIICAKPNSSAPRSYKPNPWGAESKVNSCKRKQRERDSLWQRGLSVCSLLPVASAYSYLLPSCNKPFNLKFGIPNSSVHHILDFIARFSLPRMCFHCACVHKTWEKKAWLNNYWFQFSSAMCASDTKAADDVLIYSPAHSFSTPLCNN